MAIYIGVALILYAILADRVRKRMKISFSKGLAAVLLASVAYFAVAAAVSFVVPDSVKTTVLGDYHVDMDDLW